MTDLVKALTLKEAVEVYQSCEADLRQAYALLEKTQARLGETFGGSSRYFRVCEDRPDFTKPDSALKEIQRQVWEALIDRMNIRAIMSVAKAKELDDQLSDNPQRCKDELPEITYENVMATLTRMHNQIPEMTKEAVLEVFEFLRPHKVRGKTYKTNEPFEVGNRVVLPYLISYYAGSFSVDWDDKPQLRALENVFSYLDGKGFASKTFNGYLIDGINLTTKACPTGETEYFKFRCYLNRNLHIEFKRPDLVAKLNQIAGGARLKT